MSGAGWRDLIDHEADAFAASGDGLIVEGRRAEHAARRLFGALARRYGTDAARGAFKVAAEPSTRTPRQAIKALMEATHDVLRAEGTPSPTATVARLFSGDGPLGQGRKPASVVRAVRPTRRSKAKRIK
jgi:hypothetical protein